MAQYGAATHFQVAAGWSGPGSGQKPPQLPTLSLERCAVWRSQAHCWGPKIYLALCRPTPSLWLSFSRHGWQSSNKSLSWANLSVSSLPVFCLTQGLAKKEVWEGVKKKGIFTSLYIFTWKGDSSEVEFLWPTVMLPVFILIKPHSHLSWFHVQANNYKPSLCWDSEIQRARKETRRQGRWGSGFLGHEKRAATGLKPWASEDSTAPEKGQGAGHRERLFHVSLTKGSLSPGNAAFLAKNDGKDIFKTLKWFLKKR